MIIITSPYLSEILSIPEEDPCQQRGVGCGVQRTVTGLQKRCLHVVQICHSPRFTRGGMWWGGLVWGRSQLISCRLTSDWRLGKIFYKCYIYIQINDKKKVILGLHNWHEQSDFIWNQCVATYALWTAAQGWNQFTRSCLTKHHMHPSGADLTPTRQTNKYPKTSPFNATTTLGKMKAWFERFNLTKALGLSCWQMNTS